MLDFGLRYSRKDKVYYLVVREYYFIDKDQADYVRELGIHIYDTAGHRLA